MNKNPIEELMAELNKEIHPEEIVIMEAIQKMILPRYHQLQATPTEELAIDLHEKIMQVMYAAWRYSARCEHWGFPISDGIAELFKALEKVASETMRIFNQLTSPCIVIAMRRIG